ncbi:MAG: DUF4212 domain-containing protein [Planctomycetaceae bacterium]
MAESSTPEPSDSSRPNPSREAGNQRPPAVRDVRGYWRANRNLIAVLLTIWATVSLGCGVLFVEQLNEYRIGRLPLGFWVGQQGSIFLFVLLVFVYAFAMDRLDRKYGVKE